MGNNLIVVLPECSDDLISDLLRRLTEVICRKDADKQVHGILGGEFGYGVDFENATFMMFPYYWGDCTCGAEDGDMAEDHKEGCLLLKPNFLHKPSGATVQWYKYIGRGMETMAPPNLDWTAVIQECIRSVYG